MEDLESRIDPETGKKRRGRPPKARPDGTLPPPKRKKVDEFGNAIPKGSNPIDPVTGKKKRGRPKKCDLPPGASGMAGSSSGMISEPGSVGSSTQGGNGSSSGGGVNGLPNGGMMKHDYPPPPSREDDECSESGDAPSSVSKTPTRLPPFSPNFRGMGSMHGDEEGNDPEGGMSDGDRLRPSFDGGEDGSQGSSQHDHHQMADLSARLSGGGERMPHSPPHSAGMHHPVGGEYEHSQRTSQPDHHEEASHHSGDIDDYQQQQQQRPDSARSLNHGGPPPQANCNFSNPTTPVDDVGNHGHQGYPSGYPTPPGSGFQVMKNESGHPHHTPQHQESPTYQQQHSFHAPYRTMQDTPPHQGSSSGGFDSPQPHGGRQLKQHADPGDVSTKSLTGLESLVDQIPAIAENDSGVFSGSGGGSHPPTPRSVGPYSPGQFHGGNGGSNYLNNGFSGGGYPSGGGGTPGPSSNTDNYPTDLSSTSTNYSGGNSGQSAVSVSHSPVTHSNFSVSSLAHSSVGHGRHLSSADASALDSAAAAAAAALGGHSSLSDAFSVSSLASTYASALTSEAELSKYAASNPYMSQSSMFSSSLIGASRAGISPAASNFMSAASAGMGGMAGMGMASMAGMYGMSSAAYSQYGSAAGAYSGSAAAQAFAAAASGAAAGSYPHPHHGLHMPNPSYPYPSPYPHQSPYSQSPYF